MSDGWKQFKKYALANGAHNGPASLAALKTVYDNNKGSHYHTILRLYKAVGAVMQYQAFEREMGCAECVKKQNDEYRVKIGDKA